MKVKDVMQTNVITVDARKSIDGALCIMNENKIRRLPVLENDKLVGLIVQHDIEKAIRRPGIIPETPVEWVMTKNPWVIGPDDDVVDAAILLKEKKISGLPVIESDQLVGIISDFDILELFIKIMQEK
ncbi:CBS domain protein [Candidatus Syntrophocurvum alkaliphilum]|uniref:CBS domain protein n=1 Tax=Candidatus Syntrophocurvum alkaliphilum TaxID=2293317 RepID=A0A6I6D8H4_9FIRM|nr:CBS domain-containing protein [Candidatus Syntrophocurvum alkaliphilum]QGT98847.1 CBS domain protein [Candidatus Syntrophocurvum alkaliphilum]